MAEVGEERIPGGHFPVSQLRQVDLVMSLSRGTCGQDRDADSDPGTVPGMEENEGTEVLTIATSSVILEMDGG